MNGFWLGGGLERALFEGKVGTGFAVDGRRRGDGKRGNLVLTIPINDFVVGGLDVSEGGAVGVADVDDAVESAAWYLNKR